MSYALDLPAAAQRHFLAAEALVSGHRRDVAGYLYGISIECAVKAMMLDAGLRPMPLEDRRSDPFFAHFPTLRTLLRDSLQGRRSSTLNHFIEDARLMSQWDTDMRYSHGKDIRDEWVANWQKQARDAIARMGT
jgi:hypothetical protein